MTFALTNGLTGLRPMCPAFELGFELNVLCSACQYSGKCVQRMMYHCPRSEHRDHCSAVGIGTPQKTGMPFKRIGDGRGRVFGGYGGGPPSPGNTAFFA
jgi:hypothetical protein